jgi:cyclic pyranopterin phosphate synthase
VKDSYSRNINYLRISVTDRCNLRCVYCMPPEGVKWVPHESVLAYEELIRLVEAAAELGISKVRITGGEPTVRAGIVDFVRLLALVPGLDDISMTTNGIALPGLASDLKRAGLKRVNISLDTLKPERFKSITRIGKLDDVLAGIQSAQEARLVPLKLNAVVIQGFNDDEMVDLARLSIDQELHIRFIELMPFADFHCSLGASDLKLSFLPYTQVMAVVEGALGKLEPVKSPLGNGPARYYRLPGAMGTVGFISPLSEGHFCTGCNRLRLTSEGRLRPCLLNDMEADIRPLLKRGASKDELKAFIEGVIKDKPQNHKLARGLRPQARKMIQIGG